MDLRQCLNYSKGSYFKNTVLVFIFVLRGGGIISQQEQKISSTLYIKEWYGHSTGNFILPLSNALTQQVIMILLVKHWKYTTPAVNLKTLILIISMVNYNESTRIQATRRKNPDKEGISTVKRPVTDWQ